MFNVRLCLFLVSICSAGGASATCPLRDLVMYQGKTYPLASYTSPPWNRKIADWVATLPQCSAPGQGRPVYQIEGKEVFLVNFRGCSSELSASDAYGTSASRILATWIDGRIDIDQGSCHGGWDLAKQWLIVNKGALVEFVEVPDIAKMQQKMQQKLMSETELNIRTGVSVPISKFSSDGDPNTLEVVFLEKSEPGVNTVSDDGEVIFAFEASDELLRSLIAKAFELRAKRRLSAR